MCVAPLPAGSCHWPAARAQRTGVWLHHRPATEGGAMHRAGLSPDTAALQDLAGLAGNAAAAQRITSAQYRRNALASSAWPMR
ncbi:hypothetical protein LMG919_13705 [Xanthomonas vesicatoria]|nr:hypothetical protein LMG919_13705 [Xanthomonas vesicatoria]